MNIRHRRLIPCLVLLALATSAGGRKPKRPPPARGSYSGSAYTVLRPPGEGWLEAPHRPGDVVLVRDGAADAGGHALDSWSAQVLALPSLGTADAEALGAWLDTEYRGRLVAGSRFVQRAWSVEPAPERGPLCVTYRLAAIDREAETGGGAVASLLLDERGLACDSASGAVLAKVSWRGSGDAAPAALASTLEAFLSGLRIAGGSAAPER